ncbi:MAG: LapA family protein [Rhodocyclaceae bacterium]|nr:LapA family protein [Rhodocyclaceae bacterium]MDZ4215694.1 LapA family protein [Rhodocyclaceae bacterium]
MQLGLIIGIVFAIGAVVFAMQNTTVVTVTLGFWNFEGSLALVLLVAMGVGALIAGLVSSPAMIRRQWSVAHLGRQLADEKRSNEALRKELDQAQTALAARSPAAPLEVEEKPYVGLRTLIAGSGEDKPAA